MKKGYFKGVAIAVAFMVSMASLAYAESSFNMEKDGKMYRCQEDPTIPLPKTAAKKKAYVVKKAPKKAAEVKKAEGITVKERKNTIFLEPMVYMMYSNGTQRFVVAPGLGLSYVRDLTPKFSLGFGVSYAHAFYGKFPDRTFNMYGAKMMFGFKF